MTDFLHYHRSVSPDEDGSWVWRISSRWNSQTHWTSLVRGKARWRWLATWRAIRRVRHLSKRKFA